MASTNRQYKDSARFTFGGIIGIIILTLLMLLTSCYGTYYLTDAEYSDVRESHASLTYHNNSIYWGWNSGYYYYYGTPHYYPWYYYYNACPPSHHHTTTHITINKPVNRPIYRPRPNNNRGNVTIKTNTNVKTNVNRNNNKVIIKNGSKRTNKTKVTRRPKK